MGRGAQTPFDGTLLIRRADGSVRRRMCKDVPVRPSHIALLPDSRLLMAGGRALKDDAGAWRPNAVVWSPEGEQETTLCVGDDIPAPVTDHGGSIWTAYGDEGSYGGHPQAAAGLAGGSTEGRAVWTPDGRLPDLPLQGGTAPTDGDHVWLVSGV
ncbi:hypothetical protein [Streptomyces chryseus]